MAAQTSRAADDAALTAAILAAENHYEVLNVTRQDDVGARVFSSNTRRVAAA